MSLTVSATQTDSERSLRRVETSIARSRTTGGGNVEAIGTLTRVRWNGSFRGYRLENNREYRILPECSGSIE